MRGPAILSPRGSLPPRRRKGRANQARVFIKTLAARQCIVDCAVGGLVYRLTDDVARRRVLYAAPIPIAPNVLVLDAPAEHRGAGLALGRYYPMVIETSAEIAEAEHRLAKERRAKVRPAFFERRASAVRSDLIVVTRYEPPSPGWPWLLVCSWPDDLARIASERGVSMARGRYTMEMFEAATALEEHCMTLLASLTAHRPIEVRFASAATISSAGHT